MYHTFTINYSDKVRDVSHDYIGKPNETKHSASVSKPFFVARTSSPMCGQKINIWKTYIINYKKLQNARN